MSVLALNTSWENKDGLAHNQHVQGSLYARNDEWLFHIRRETS